MKTFFSAAMVAAAIAYPAFAQSTDSATSNLSVTLEANIFIGGLDDIALLPSSNGAYSNFDDFCIVPTLGTFSVSYAGSGPAGAFELSEPNSGDSLTYRPFFQQIFVSGGDNTPILMEPNVPATGLTTAGTNFCDALNPTNSNSNLIVNFFADAVIGLSGGDYTGTLTVLVAAE